jgi:hypothetical protein
MRKMLILILGLAVVLYVGFTWFRKEHPAPADDAPSAAKSRLDNVRAKARGFEEDAERRNREALEKTEGK